MAYSHMMVAWAIPIEIVKAGSHVQTYVETRRIMDTFKLCVIAGARQKAAIGKLPVELTEMIRGYLKASIPYRTKRKKRMKGESRSHNQKTGGVLKSWKRKVRCTDG